MKNKNTEYRTQNVVLKQNLLSSKFYKLLTSKTGGFTLIELIVTIVILAILGTIAFISFQGYSRNSRDSVRIADINSVEKSLGIFIVKTGFYPIPDSNKEITYAGGPAWIEGTIGDIVMKNIDNVSKKPIDPLTSNEYTYSITSSKKEYEIGAISEGQSLTYNNSFVPNSYAADLSKTNAVAYMKGNYNEKIIKIATGGINYILAIPTIIVTDITNPRIEDLIAEKKLVYRNFTNIPHSYNPTGTGGFDYETNRIEVYSGAAISLEDNINKINFVENLQDAYSGTIIGGTENYQDITNIDTSTEADKAVDLVNNYITNNVGGITGKITTLIYNTCALDGQIIDHNQTITAYSENSILSGASYECVDRSQERTCNNGVLSGDDSYQYKSCVKGTAVICSEGYEISGNSCVPITYTVNFDGNGGTGHTPTTKSVDYNTAIGTLPSNPTMSGYTFNGWYTTSTGGSQVTESTIVLGNTTVYANWSVAVGSMELVYTGLVNGDIIELPFKGTVNITNIDWGDDGVNTCPTTATGIVSCTYTNASKGSYTIHVSGLSTGFGKTTTASGITKLTQVPEWQGMGLTDLSNAFRGASNLVYLDPSLDTSNVTDMSWLFLFATSFNQSLSNFDTSKVTNMKGMFYGASVFNQSLSSFNTSNVTNMSSMFRDATVFNQSLSSFDTSNVTDMAGMFTAAKAFNQSLSNFDTSNVLYMYRMFSATDNFNQSLSNFNTSKVTTMMGMFDNAKVFNQPLSNFNTSNVTSMAGMFMRASSFNQPLTNFNTSKVTTMNQMFNGATLFNQSLSNFDTSKVTNMSWMFTSASTFNQSLSNFDTSNVINMSYMFMGASSFNQPLTNFNTSKVTNMSSMFGGAISFNQPLTNFDTSNVTDMSYMFNSATSFNQPLSNFNTSNVINMSGMFRATASFNQSLSNFDTSKVTNMSQMFASTTIFNQPLPFDTLSVTNMQGVFSGAIAFNQSLNSFNTSNVTDMSKMFLGASSFNQPLNSFDTSKVTNMQAMFYGAIVFNQSLSNFNTSNVTNMSQMFYLASAFNQPLSNFNTSNVINMSFMFYKASSFNQSLSNFNTSKVTSSNMTAMFWYTTNFSKNISCWNVGLIASLPTSFATSSALLSSNYPLWGTNGSTGTCE
ncbi:MAG: BspA family leucine-rich repeat surface protein [Candidatus Gracilibacteria bacterium]|nr:BspA family leucine-rich repeat surface protein [Candidatus Gracilibacteria bacterium]